MAGDDAIDGARRVKASSKSYDPRTWVDPDDPEATRAQARPLARAGSRAWLAYLLSAALLAGGAAGAYATRPEAASTAP